MADMINLTREKFTNIADAIRSATGGTDKYTVDEMPSVIERLSTGGGCSVPNGFTVNFYDEENNMIQSNSAICGHNISTPLSYKAPMWADINGASITFPFTSDTSGEVINLYAKTDIKYLINPEGTDFNTTFILPDGNPQAGVLLWEGNKSSSIASLTNYTENTYRLLAGREGGGNCGLMFTSPIPCADYKYLNIKWLYVYDATDTDGEEYPYGQINLAKDTSQGECGHALNKYRSSNLASSSYTTEYYKNMTGDANWTLSKALNDTDNLAWRTSQIPLTYTQNDVVLNITQFYLNIQTWDAVFWIAEIYLS